MNIFFILCTVFTMLSLTAEEIDVLASPAFVTTPAHSPAPVPPLPPSRPPSAPITPPPVMIPPVQTEEARNEPYLFGLDVVQCLREYTDACETKICKDKYKTLYALYKTKAHLEAAKQLISKWSDPKNVIAQRCYAAFKEGIDDMLTSNQLFLNICECTSSDTQIDAAQAHAKWEQGRIKVATASKLFPRVIFYFEGETTLPEARYTILTRRELTSLRDYINQQFKKDLSRPDLPEELFSLLVIQHHINSLLDSTLALLKKCSLKEC